jgi:hypothetical protein
METRTFIWRGLIAICVLLVMVAPAAAQIAGQLTEFSITGPGDLATPYRTSNDTVGIAFSHNAGTGSLFINTDGADIEGSSFIGTGGAAGEPVCPAFLNTDGIKTIALVAFQTRINVTARTLNSVSVQYDRTAPEWQINTINLDAAAAATPSAGIPFDAGTIYYTNTGSFSLRGTVADPDNGSAPEETTFSATGLSVPLVDQAWGQADGSWTGDIAIAGPDGRYTLSITASDSFSGGNSDPSSRPNQSQPKLVNIIKDTAAPTIENVQIITKFGTAEQKIMSTGATTYVGGETVVIKVTMSEEMGLEPQVSVTQANGVAIQTAVLSGQTIGNRVFFYQYSVVATDAQNGPALVTITGQYDAAGGNPDFGYDLAYNPIDGADPLGNLPNAFMVDTIAPTLIQFATVQPGNIISVPEDGSRIGKKSFPDTVQVFVEDYDNLNGTSNASGVNFDNGISTGSTSGTAAASGTTKLTITLLAPGNLVVNGTPSIAPPNGMFLTLPDWSNPELAIPGFTDPDGDGIAEPIEGTWTIRLGLIDEVGNSSQETIIFTVDNTPINVSDLLVTFELPPASGNPLEVTGNCVGLAQVSGGYPTISVTSSDPTFSATRTVLAFYSQIGGTNSQPKKFDSDPPTLDGAIKTITNIRRPNLPVATDDWPIPENPAQPAAYVPYGSMDPRVGIYDGLYLVRVTPFDNAGNSGVRQDSGVINDYQDYEVNLDTIDPYVAWTFPAGHQAINEPLRFVDAVIVDPAAPNGNAGCGVDTSKTDLTLWLAEAYRPNSFDPTYIESQQTVPPISQGRIRGTLRFIHNPNNTDPTQPSFNPSDDTYRVLLELVDSSQVVRPLKEDGSMDGIYYLGVNPFDNAGNNLDVDVFNSLPAEKGNYFGMKASDTTTINATRFPFLYDTIEPELTVNNFTENTYIGGTVFTITGTSRDLSAIVADPTKGGAGILKVEYKLEVVDENGVPLASEPARQSTTNTDPGAWLPAQNNPVVPWKSSTLQAITKNETPTNTGSNSPIRSTTFPMDTGFKDSQREIRSFKINGVLPATEALLKPRQNRTNPPDPNPDTTANDYYRMTIRSWDRAGNFTDVARKVIVSLKALKAPVLISPVCGTYVNNPVVKFQWNTVTGATAYKFQLLYPNANILEKTVTTNEVQLTIPIEGQYRWRVATVDGTGNTSAYSEYCTLYLDRTAPVISQFFITANNVPAQQQGTLYLGDFVVNMAFSEPLLKTKPISVSFDPVGAIGAPAQAVTTSEWINTGTTSNWTGTANVPRSGKPEEWDGQVTFTVSGATDLAGNAMKIAYNSNYELDTGPWFTTKFFSSIFNEAEFTMIITSSENLVQIPTLSNMSGLTWQGTDQALKQMQGTQKTYYATMKLSSLSNGQVSFDISGSDLDQNQSRRTIEFSVSRPLNSSVASQLNFSALSISFPEGVVTKAASIYVFPPSTNDEDISTAASALGIESTNLGKGSSLQGGELIDIAQIADIQSPRLGLNGAVTFKVPVPENTMVPAGSPQIGIYGKQGDSWIFLGNRRNGELIEGETDTLCEIKLAADMIGPSIELLSHRDGDTMAHSRVPVEVRIADFGSGIDLSSVKFTFDGKAVPYSYDEALSRLTWIPEKDVQPGNHEILVTASDLSSNAGNTVQSNLIGPEKFGFAEPPLPYPNPARSYSKIRYSLTQASATQAVTIKIYDVSGRKIRTIQEDASSANGGLGFDDSDNNMEWDLRDGRGRTVSNGVYVFRVKVNSSTGSSDTYDGKIAVLR